MWDHMRKNVVAYIALFFSLGIGTAWAGTMLANDSVRSKHIVDGQVRTPDLAPNALANPRPSEDWTNVQPNPQQQADPCPSQTAIFCGFFRNDLQTGWANYGSEWAVAAFYKDREGVVHLKGLLNPNSIGDSFPSPYTIFVLPPGYRPTESRLFETRCYDDVPGHCRVDVKADGRVVWVNEDGGKLPNEYLTLEGVSFRAG